MKIAIFTETYLPYINGVVTHVKILREGLINMGHEVLIITADTSLKTHTLENGILRCPALELRNLYGYGLASPVSRAVENTIREFNPDVIHIEQEFSLGLEGMRCARKLKLPLIYTLHTLYDYYIYYIAPRPFTDVVKKISHRYIRFFARRADIITGPSEKCQDYLKSMGVTRKLHVIPNPVEMESYGKGAVSEEERRSLRNALNIPDDAFLGCFCGRLGKEKMADELIKIYKENLTDNDYLLILGDGPSRPELTHMAKYLGVEDRIIFTGAIPHEKLAPYYAISDYYATASVSDTYSISMLEAQASGLYVLQKYDIKNAYQTRQNINGELFTTGDDFRKIVEKLKNLSQEEKDELSERVIDSVKMRSSEAVAKSMSQLYSIAIEKNKNKHKDVL